MHDSKSLEATEAVGAFEATHPRVSLDDIKDAIRSVYYLNGYDAVACTSACRVGDQPALSLFTLCILVMKNNFVIIGKSAPASPENFDTDKGQLFAYEDAVRQLWPLMGFALRERLADARG